MGFLSACDRIVTNRDHLLYEAKREARHMADSGYRPPLPEPLRGGARRSPPCRRSSTCSTGGYATDYDRVVGEHIAWVLCGGDLSNRPGWMSSLFWTWSARRSSH